MEFTGDALQVPPEVAATENAEDVKENPAGGAESERLFEGFHDLEWFGTDCDH